MFFVNFQKIKDGLRDGSSVGFGIADNRGWAHSCGMVDAGRDHGAAMEKVLRQVADFRALVKTALDRASVSYSLQ
jgi:hypothetical protein